MQEDSKPDHVGDEHDATLIKVHCLDEGYGDCVRSHDLADLRPELAKKLLTKF